MFAFVLVLESKKCFVTGIIPAAVSAKFAAKTAKISKVSNKIGLNFKVRIGIILTSLFEFESLLKFLTFVYSIISSCSGKKGANFKNG